MTSVPGNLRGEIVDLLGLEESGRVVERLGKAGDHEGDVGPSRRPDGHERVGGDMGRLVAQHHTVLGVLDRRAARPCERRSRLVEPVDDQERLRHPPPGHLRDRRLVEPGEDPQATPGGMDHAEQLDLVRAVAVDAEKPDQAVGPDPQEVVHDAGWSRLERPQLQLEPPAVDRGAGRGELLDAADVLRREPVVGAEQARRLLLLVALRHHAHLSRVFAAGSRTRCFSGRRSRAARLSRRGAGPPPLGRC